MAVRRAQLSGPFGGGAIAQGPRPVDYSSIIAAATNGANQILHQRAVMQIAQQQRDEQAQQRRDVLAVQKQRDDATNLYRNAVLQHTTERDATNAAASRDRDWNANADRTERTRLQAERDDAVRERDRLKAERQAMIDAQPKSPVLGTPQYLKAKTDVIKAQATATASNRAPKPAVAPKIDPMEAKRLQYVQQQAGLLTKPTKSASGRSVPGMAPDEAIAEANRRWQAISTTPTAAPVTTPPAAGVLRRPTTPVVQPPLSGVPLQPLSARDKQAAASDAGFEAELKAKGYVKGRDY